MLAVPLDVPVCDNVAASFNDVSTTIGSVLSVLPSAFLPSLSFDAALPDSCTSLKKFPSPFVLPSKSAVPSSKSIATLVS